MKRRSPVRRSLPLALVLVALAMPGSAQGQDGTWTTHPTWASGYGFVDPVRSRVIVFRPPLTWAYSTDDGNWSVLSTSGSAPAGVRHAVYDRLRDRCLALTQDATGTRLYSLNLSGHPTWQLVHHTTQILGEAGPRSLMHDAVRDRLLYWGGRDEFTGMYSYFAARLMQLDLVSLGPWLDIGAIDHRCFESAIVLDESARCLWVFGGFTQSFPHDEYPGGIHYSDDFLRIDIDADPVTVTRPARTTPRPAARSGAHLILDPARHRTLLMGGTMGDASSWQLDAAEGTWRQIAAPHLLAPCPTIVKDPTADRLLALHWAPHASGTFRLTSDEWSAPFAPEPRRMPAIVYDSARHRMLSCSGAQYDDLWSLSLDTMRWSFVQSLVPAGRVSGSCAIYDPIGDRVILFGGETGSVPTSNLWQLALADMTWSPLEVDGAEPEARSMASVAYDPLRHRLILSGGRGVGGALADTWQLQLGDVPAWSRMGIGDGLPAHENGSMVYAGHLDAMLLVLPDGTTWTMPLFDGGTWTLLPTTSSPGRGGQAVWDFHRRSAVVLLSDSRVFRLTIDGSARWSPLATTGDAPQIADESRVVFDPIRGAMITWGRHGLIRLDWPDVATHVDVSLVSAVASGTAVRLHWRMGPNLASTIERRDAAETSWRAIGHATSDGVGDLRFEDDAAPAGARLGYRLRIGESLVAGEAHVTTPAPALGFVAAGPVPASRAAISLTLPAAATGEIDLLDVAGRRVDRVRVDDLAPGTHRIEFQSTGPGLYFARLRTPEVARTVRLLVTR